MEKKKILKTNEAAAYLGVSRSSIINWVKQGLLEGGSTPGGHLRFTLEDLNSFAESRSLDIPARQSDSPVMKILLVEDDEAFRLFLRDALESFSSYELKEAPDGMKGAMLAGSWKPDLIILDVRMPNMNGMDFLKLIRENPETADTSVIVASAHLSEDIRKQLEDLDADVILEKPVRLAKLIASVQKLLNLPLSE